VLHTKWHSNNMEQGLPADIAACASPLMKMSSHVLDIDRRRRCSIDHTHESLHDMPDPAR